MPSCIDFNIKYCAKLHLLNDYFETATSWDTRHKRNSIGFEVRYGMVGFLFPHYFSVSRVSWSRGFQVAYWNIFERICAVNKSTTIKVYALFWMHFRVWYFPFLRLNIKSIVTFYYLLDPFIPSSNDFLPETSENYQISVSECEFFIALLFRRRDFCTFHIFFADFLWFLLLSILTSSRVLLLSVDSADFSFLFSLSYKCYFSSVSFALSIYSCLLAYQLLDLPWGRIARNHRSLSVLNCYSQV